MSLGYSVRRAQLLGTASLLSMMLASQMASANPLGGTVEAGSASIKTTTTGTLNVTQSTNKAIINWKSFNIGAGETTRFSLPSSTSVTLNRDFSGDPSKILGNLKSNGRLFLVNRNGILFGKDAHVDVAGLVATTHDIRSQDFLAGKLNFTIPGNPSASVVNHGQITVDDLGFGAFVAPHVRNDGAIVARLGKVALASANGFTLDLYGDNLISFLVENPNKQVIYDKNGKPVTALVKNAGKIIADGGQVVLSAAAARGVINDVINTDGIIQANTVSRRGGKIILGGGATGTVTVAGKVTARGNKAGEKGGKIIATGETLVADSSANIDVSGWIGGGKLLFGGDYHGGDAPRTKNVGFTLENAAIQNAKTTMVEAGATLAANSIVAGNGGKVVVWADDHTTFAGAISATGGPSGGNGGSVEVSGKQQIDFTGAVNLRAQKGQTGTLLLDPANITISNDPSTVYVASNIIPITPTTGNSILKASDLENVLRSANVAITTGGSSAAQTGDININAPITWNTNYFLSLAAHNINVNAPITSTGASSGLILRTGGSGSDGWILDTGGTLNVNAPITLSRGIA